MEFNSAKVSKYIKNQISKFDSKNISLLVLGCTHFNYFKDSFIDLMPNSKIVDGVDGTIRQIKRKIDELNSKGKNLDTKLLYYSSKEQKDIKEIAPFLLRLDKMARI
jgi:glutamate racemase